jgi:hypothetical protein
MYRLAHDTPNLEMMVFGEFEALWPAPASSRYAFSGESGMLL